MIVPFSIYGSVKFQVIWAGKVDFTEENSFVMHLYSWRTMLGQILEGAVLTLFAAPRVADRMLNSSGSQGWRPALSRLASRLPSIVSSVVRGFVTERARAHPASLKSHNGKSIPRMRALIHSRTLDARRRRAKHWQGRAKPPPWWMPFLKLLYGIYLEIYGTCSSDMWKVCSVYCRCPALTFHVPVIQKQLQMFDY